METIYVPQSKFLEFEEYNDDLSRYAAGQCSKPVFLANKEYLYIGSMYYVAPQTKQSEIRIQQVVDLVAYTGKLEPLPYNGHFDEVKSGHRERSYAGMLVQHKSRKLVFIGEEVKIHASVEGVQLAIF